MAGITPACAGSTRLCGSNRPRTRDHPRLRGEHAGWGKILFSDDGSPPPARGAPYLSDAHRPRVGITPACAGSTGYIRVLCRDPSDHPRLRGEHHLCELLEDSKIGSPPPARGAHDLAALVHAIERITPACAGSTMSSSRCASNFADHPRLRGEHPSPEPRTTPCRRITPACAGSTV